MSSNVPDSWPPAPSGRRQVRAPLFPLPGAFLFPRQLMALHVFEPRYRKMVEDSLDGPGRLVIGTIDESQHAVALDPDVPTQVLPVAGMGEIARHEKLEDGRFLVWLLGLARVTVAEEPSDEPYRQVLCTPLAEFAPSPEDRERLDDPLREAALSRHKELLNLPDDVPTEILVDLLCQRLDVPQRIMEDIFSEPDLTQRAELALAAHARFPLVEGEGDEGDGEAGDGA